MFRISVCQLVFSAVLPVLAHAQQSVQTPGDSSPRLVLHSTTRAVVLDIVVTDQTGKPVGNLSKSDFTILEDGVAQEIASFETPGVHLHPLSYVEQSQTVLVLDEMNTRFEDLAFARYAVAKLLERNSGKLEMPTALMALTNSGLVQLHDYTTAGSELLQALERHRAELPWRLRTGMEGAKERLATSIGAIQEIAYSRADYKARKNVVWVSPGFPIITTSELLTEDRSVLFEAIRMLSDELLRTRITIYTVDPRGVTVGRLLAAADQPSYLHSTNPAAGTTVADLALERLALETGGEALYGRNNLDQEIEDTIVNGAMYFTLSYYPSNRNWDGTFRKVRVNVDKPGLHATTRDGYFALAALPPAADKEAALQLTSAVSSRLSFGAIPVKVSPAELVQNVSTEKLTVDVDGQALSWTPSDKGDYHCKVQVVLANLSNKGERLDYRVQSVGGVIPGDKFARSKSRSWVIPVEVPVKPEAARIRVVVRDDLSGKLGTADISWPASTQSH